MMKPAVSATDEDIRDLFRNTAASFNQTLGGTTGYLALGAILAYGAGPEIYSTYNAFPGLWLHGETNQGKSSVARWLMRVWGFKVDSGMPLADSTKVRISIALQQYGNLPLYLEEFQPTAPQWMVEKIKKIYNRESGIKKTFEEGMRKILTNVIVTGVATCTDVQVKSRYAHVKVSAKNREVPLYDWFEENSPRSYLLGRYILKNRKRFAALTLEKMKEWLHSTDMAGINERARLVHGAVLVRAGHLKPLGKLAQNARKWYATVDIYRMSCDPDWRDEAIRIVEKQIQEMNQKRRGKKPKRPLP